MNLVVVGSNPTAPAILLEEIFMLVLKNHNGFKSLCSGRYTEYKEGDCILALSGEVLSSPTQTSIKIALQMMRIAFILQ